MGDGTVGRKKALGPKKFRNMARRSEGRVPR